jgi:hypothetical protein
VRRCKELTPIFRALGRPWSGVTFWSGLRWSGLRAGLRASGPWSGVTFKATLGARGSK